MPLDSTDTYVRFNTALHCPTQEAHTATSERNLSEPARRRQRRQRPALPIYETLEGWRDSTRGARSWADLPAQAIKYVRRIEELIEAPVTLLSTSPERDDTIMVRDPFAD